MMVLEQVIGRCFLLAASVAAAVWLHDNAGAGSLFADAAALETLRDALRVRL